MPSEPRIDLDGLELSPEERPADERVEAVRRILAGTQEPHRSALASALEEARGVLYGLRAVGNGRVARTASELGALALGPLDPARFTSLLAPEASPDPVRLQRFEEAVSVLEWAAAEAAPPCEVGVEPGGSLRDTVAAALTERGRMYGAVRVVALLRAGGFSEGAHAGLLDGLPFREWRTLERSLAPPLVVSVQGTELATVAGLGEFLDGTQKLVLLVRGPCPPAPLARLITPGTLVLQAVEVDALERVAAFPGPAVAALVPDGAARFLYDPEAGAGRGLLELHHVPASPPRGWVDGMSPAQQAAELRLLEAWREASAGAATSAAGPAHGDRAGAFAPAGGDSHAAPPSDPAERLAAWLLSQADPGGDDG